MQAGALSCLGPGVLPPKLNHVIKPLMEAVKKAGIRSEFFLVLILYRFPFFKYEGPGGGGWLVCG